MTRVVVNGIGFSGTTIPEEGLIYSRLVDWDGRPGARGGGDSIPGGQGVFPRAEELRESRVISVEAAIIADTADEFFAVKRRVENMPMFGEMFVEQGGEVWTRQVEVEQINIPDSHERTNTKFTIDLLAPDPVRYSELLTAGPALLPVRSGGLVLPSAFPWDFGTDVWSKATVVNSGELPLLPRVTVTGSGSGLVIHGGPYRVAFGAWSGTFVADSRERRAWLNGVDVTRGLLRREWPVVAPGLSADFWFGSDGVAAGTELLVEYRIGVW